MAFGILGLAVVFEAFALRAASRPDELLVAAKVEFDHELSLDALARSIDACQARLRAVLPDMRLTIYLEPELAPSAGASTGPGPPLHRANAC